MHIEQFTVLPVPLCMNCCLHGLANIGWGHYTKIHYFVHAVH
jgi:hypothetical protein